MTAASMMMKMTTNLTRKFVSFPIKDPAYKKLQMLNWANRFNICCFLDNNEYKSPYHEVECLLAAGAVHTLTAAAGNAFEQLQQFGNTHQDWLFGHLGYELKNEIENLHSAHKDNIGFADLFFFVPEIVVELTSTHMRIGGLDDNLKQVYDDITATSVPSKARTIVSAGNLKVDIDGITKHVNILSRFDKSEYIATVRQLQQHILRGDCYEINFCQEFYAENMGIDPVETFLSLSRRSPNPFAAFYKVKDKYLMCASPERYLKKDGTHVVSQPIKGTLKRLAALDRTGAQDASVLADSAKDRSENVMVVDLVRNDLSRVCVEGSVKVDELFGIYTFPQVYQMISTVSGELPGADKWLEALTATFPMGSMTGAPKKNVLQLIEKYERSRRGIFSGAVGYITPEKDFDFNVVIRSLMYNEATGYLSFPAGSGITFYSEAEQEYEECLVKVGAIRSILEEAAAG
jgi:para-aminobenzoate synthetase component I